MITHSVHHGYQCYKDWLNFFTRLFVLPQYCGTLLEQGLLLNRRRNDMEEPPKQRLHKVDTVIEETLSTAGKRVTQNTRVYTVLSTKTRADGKRPMKYDTNHESVCQSLIIARRPSSP